MITLEVTKLITDDEYGFESAIGAPLENIPEKKREQIVKSLTEQNIYAQLPGTSVADFIVRNKIKCAYMLSDVGVIANQQRVWFENVFSKHQSEYTIVEHGDSVDGLLIHSDRRLLSKHGASGGNVLPVSNLKSQFEFITNILKESN